MFSHFQHVTKEKVVQFLIIDDTARLKHQYMQRCWITLWTNRETSTECKPFLGSGSHKTIFE